MMINKEQDLTSDIKIIGELKELSPKLLYANQSITRSNSNQLTINTMSSFDTKYNSLKPIPCLFKYFIKYKSEQNCK